MKISLQGPWPTVTPMKRRQLHNLGVPEGPAMEAALLSCASVARERRTGSEMKAGPCLPATVAAKG